MSTINLLIVEDSKTYNKTISTLLGTLGYNIFQAFTLKEALEIISKEKIDFVLLDLLLPDGEGDELLFDINSQNTQNSPKIIVLSGTKDIQRRNYLFENGVVDYFSKETPLRILIHDINELIKRLTLNNNKNILVVDDSSFVRRSIENILKIKNYNVLLAKDPIEAFEVIKKASKIDLIFSDLEMPNMDGVEFLEELKKDKKLKDIPVLILSSSENRENYARVLKHGAIDFIKKPFLTEEILLKCDLHIKNSEYLSEIAEQAKELEEYKRVLDESDIVSKGDARGNIKYVNKKFCDISGFERSELIGRPHSMVRHPDMPNSVFTDMWEALKNKETFKGILKNRKKDGSAYYVDATISPIIDTNGNIKEIIGVRHDITDVMNPKKQLLDDLSYLEKPILIILKIDNYSLFKEFYSESIMNKFEKEFEEKSISYFPEISGITKAYNLNNGFFAYLKNDILDANNIEMCLNKTISSFKEKGIMFQGNKYDINVRFSFSMEKKNIFDDVMLGISFASKNRQTIVYAKDFYRRAQINARNKLKVVKRIKGALEGDGEFISYFQPIIDNNSGKIAKYESLIRLKDKSGKIMSPFFFLDLAKKTGYYHQITNIVLDNSFEALRHTDKDITLNLAASDIENLEIRTKLLKLITKPENKGRVTFEVLEDEDIDDFSVIKDFLALSKIIGNVKIAIDDFGSGYSNFERLVDFQPDILKIDGSLIKNITTDEYSKHVVEAIVLFAKKEKIQTVAEFVADEEVLKLVKELGIDYSQGYYLGEPKPLY